MKIQIGQIFRVPDRANSSTSPGGDTLHILPENYRESYSKLELRGGVAALVEMHQSEGYRWEWPADLVASVSKKYSITCR